MHDPSSRPIKWRWYRVVLSIRAMIVLVVVVGCSLGWVVHRTRVQRDAVNAVMRVGGRGEVSYDWEYKDGNDLSKSGVTRRDGALEGAHRP